MSDHYDVIVIGSGAGGGTVAHTLAPTGKRISCSNGAGSCLGNPRTGTHGPARQLLTPPGPVGCQKSGLGR